MTTDTPPPRRSRKWQIIALAILALLGGGLYVLHELREDRIRRNEAFAINQLREEAWNLAGVRDYPSNPELPLRPEGVASVVYRLTNLFGHDPTGEMQSRIESGSLRDPVDSLVGYCFRSRLGKGNHAFTTTADPLEPGFSGRRGFFIDQTGKIRWTDGRRATTADPILKE